MNPEAVMVITGTRKGIGRHLAQHYCERNIQVVGCSRTDDDVLDLPNYEHFSCDVADEKSVRALFSAVRSKHGRLDALVNNAGIASMNHSLLTPGKTVERVLSTNVTGLFLASREAAKLMQRNKKGRIVNFTTVATPLRLAGESVYAASKAAVVSLTQILAKEFADFGITVNAVGPTPIETDLIRSVPTEKIRALVAQQAVQRLGEYRDVTNVVDFFLRPESDFVTGQVIYLGGVPCG